MTLPNKYTAFVATKDDSGAVQLGTETRESEALPACEVTVRVEWSSVNYKDALACRADGRVARISPLVPGIDLAGSVIASDDPDTGEGDRVVVHGYDLGVAHDGGFAELARVPAAWVVPLPESLTARDAMIIGTAGFTAALSVLALEDRGLGAADGPVLVTGATGGVGSTAVAMLAGRGYEVVASTGKDTEHEYLRALGAAGVVGRDEIAPESTRPLEREQWAGAVDCVGGAALQNVLRSLRYGAAVAASGNTGGVELITSVFPFILRGVALLGIDSVQCPIDMRRSVWARIAADLRPRDLERIVASEITLAELPGALDAIHAGAVRGRTLVRLA